MARIPSSESNCIARKSLIENTLANKRSATRHSHLTEPMNKKFPFLFGVATFLVAGCGSSEPEIPAGQSLQNPTGRPGVASAQPGTNPKSNPGSPEFAKAAEEYGRRMNAKAGQR